MRCVNKKTSVLALATFTVMMLLPEVPSLELTIRIIECTPQLIESNKNFVAAQGFHKSDIGISGTIHLYESKSSSEKWLYYAGEFDLKGSGYPVKNITLVSNIVFDYVYRTEGKTLCLHMERVSCN